MTRKTILSTFTLAMLVTPLAQAADDLPEITRQSIPLEYQRTRDGRVLYQGLCAACHGVAGHGNGPAAELLKPAPPSLTQLSANNGGKFPSIAVLHSISGKYHSAIPGSEMPGWEEVFNQTTGDLAAARHRVYNLTQYLKELQETHVAVK